MAFTPVIPDVSFLGHEWQELAELIHPPEWLYPTLIRPSDQLTELVCAQ